MKNKFYLHEFQIFDGEAWITFNIVDLNELKNEISVAVTNRGKITVVIGSSICQYSSPRKRKAGQMSCFFFFFVPRPSSNTARTRLACFVLWVRNIAPPSPAETLQGGANSRTSPYYVRTIRI